MKRDKINKNMNIAAGDNRDRNSNPRDNRDRQTERAYLGRQRLADIVNKGYQRPVLVQNTPNQRDYSPKELEALTADTRRGAESVLVGGYSRNDKPAKITSLSAASPSGQMAVNQQ